LGLVAIYGLHQVVAKAGPGKPSGHSLAPVPPSKPGSDGKPTNWFPYDPGSIDMFDTESPYPPVGAKAPAARPLETVR
jgi:hypothetical protein